MNSPRTVSVTVMYVDRGREYSVSMWRVHEY